MSCPCFITNDIGFCGQNDFMYIPTIAEMEKFCFTQKFGSCRLFADKGNGSAKDSSKYTKALADLFVSAKRNREGSRSPEVKRSPE